MFEKKFSIKDFEKFIRTKIFPLGEEGFYVITVGNEKHEPTETIIADMAESLKNTFPKMRFIVVPNYFKIQGFEPMKTRSTEDIVKKG